MIKMFLTLLLIPFFCFANPAPFGLELKKTTLKEFKEKYPSYSEIIHPYSGYKTFSLAPTTVNFEGIKALYVVFNADEIVVAIMTEFNKERFDSLLVMLQSKYTLYDKEIPFVGTKVAIFKEGDVVIELEAKHLSFDLTMIYITQEYLDLCRSYCTEKEQETFQIESSKL